MIWTEKECLVLKNNWLNNNIKNISKLLPKHTPGSLYAKAAQLNLKEKNYSNGYLKILLEETPETYYWIGFIMADGCITHKNFRFRIALAEKDKNHIKKLSNYIQTPYTIIPMHGFGNKKENGKQYCIEKSDKFLISKIIEKFNFKPRKTYNPPNDLNIENDNLFISFLIGFIDGDGCITNNTNQIRINCHYSWADCLNKWFERVWNLSGSIIMNLNQKIPRCEKRIDNCRAIATTHYTFVWFLKNKVKELNLPVLKRKWDRIIKKNIKFYDTFKLKKDFFEYYEQGYNNREISNLTKINVSYVSKTLRKILKNRNINLINRKTKNDKVL